MCIAPASYGGACICVIVQQSRFMRMFFVRGMQEDAVVLGCAACSGTPPNFHHTSVMTGQGTNIAEKQQLAEDCQSPWCQMCRMAF